MAAPEEIEKAPGEHEFRVENLRAPRLLVAGDLMLDEYIWGSVSRISPEAPVPIVAGRHREFKAGGAGSVVENLAVLGARVQACGLLADDEAGEHFESILSKQGVSRKAIVRTEDRPTTRKIRVMASVQQAHRGQQQICRIDFEESIDATTREIERIEQVLQTIFQDPPAAILISDYEKGMLSPEVLSMFMARGREFNVPVLIDPGRSVDYDRYRGATLICPNRFEAEQATELELRGTEDFQACCDTLISRLDLAAVALTLDRDGIFLAQRGMPGTLFPTRAHAVADVAGAGDMVLSLLGLAIGSGWTLEDAVRLANIGAGIEVSKVGVTPVETWELAQAIEARDEGSLSKVRALSDLERIVARDRSVGRRVVFANGCFDILHAGHIKLLEKARALGDSLVVGLNSDASIRRIKGETRPIVNGENRALVLSALPYVDHIVFFEDDTPIELIERLLPTILVKGTDYANKEVVGSGVVEANGGRVELVTLRPEISTTNIVDRIRQNEGLADT